MLDMRQNSILLRLIKAMNLIDKHNSGLAAKLPEFAGIFDDFAQVGHTSRNRAEPHEMGACDTGDDLGEGSFATARWPPQDHGRDSITLDAAT